MVVRNDEIVVAALRIQRIRVAGMSRASQIVPDDWSDSLILRMWTVACRKVGRLGLLDGILIQKTQKTTELKQNSSRHYFLTSPRSLIRGSHMVLQHSKKLCLGIICLEANSRLKDSQKKSRRLLDANKVCFLLDIVTSEQLTHTTINRRYEILNPLIQLKSKSKFPLTQRMSCNFVLWMLLHRRCNVSKKVVEISKRYKQLWLNTRYTYTDRSPFVAVLRV